MPEETRLELTKYSDMLYTVYDNLDYHNKMYVTFSTCLRKEKSLCQYAPCVRFPYADVRSLSAEEVTPSILTRILGEEYLKPLRELTSEKDLTPIEKGIIIQYTTILNWVMLSLVNVLGSVLDTYLLSDNFSQSINDIFKTFPYPKLSQLQERLKSNIVQRDGHRIHRVKAQLDSLRKDNVIHNGSTMAGLILLYARDRYHMIDLDRMYREWYDYYRGYYLPIYEGHGELEVTHPILPPMYVGSGLLDFAVMIMDIYVLARMFRTFRHPRKGDEHHVSSTVLIYTGAYHTDAYAKFFSQYLGLVPTLVIPPIPVPEDMRESLTQQYQEEHPRVTVVSDMRRCLHDSNLKTIFRSP